MQIYLDSEFERKLPTKFDKEKVVWKRPKEIYNDAIFFDKNVDVQDIKQGLIGSCWILTNFINMVNFLPLLLNIFNPLQSFEDSNGKFTFFL